MGFVSFSPIDDETIIFSKDSDGNEQSQLYTMDIGSNTAHVLKDDPKTQFFYGGWSRDGRSILYSSNERNGIDYDVFKYDCASKDHLVIFTDGGRVFGNGFSPSGRYTLITRNLSNVDQDVYLVDVSDSTSPPVLLTPHTTPTRYASTRWLEDESGFFVLSDHENEFICLYFYDLATKTMSMVHEYGWDVESLSLSRANDRLITVVNEDGFTRSHFYNVDGRNLTEAHVQGPEGIIRGYALSIDGNVSVYERSLHGSHYNVWLWDQATDEHEAITTLESVVPVSTFVEPTLIHYQSFDGLVVPAFLYMPKHAEGQVSAVVNIHGGPEGQSRPGPAPLTQYWVSKGFAVLVPNVRGSTGYGRTYVTLDDKRKRLDSVEDLRGLHQWAMTDERIDENRMALLGGSYGGYMVLAGLAFQPELWAGGVDIVGIANFVTFLENTSPYRRKIREAEYGSLEKDREFLEKASPIHKVNDIKAPLFIIHGANDPRVPLNEAQQMYDSLKSRGIESKFLVYEDEGHGLAKLKNRLDAYPQVASFFEDILKK